MLGIRLRNAWNVKSTSAPVPVLNSTEKEKPNNPRQEPATAFKVHFGRVDDLEFGIELRLENL